MLLSHTNWVCRRKSATIWVLDNIDDKIYVYQTIAP